MLIIVGYLMWFVPALGLAALQLAGQAQNVDPRVAVDIGFAGNLAKKLTDGAKAMYGWDIAKHPPRWFPISCAFGFGIICMGIAMKMSGLDILDGQNLAACLGLGITSGGDAVATTVLHNEARPQAEPAIAVPTPPFTPSNAVTSASVPTLTPSNSPVATPIPAPAVVAPVDVRAAILAAARRYEGVPYVWGGTAPTGMDCSGFTQRVYADCGLVIPRTAEQQRQALTPIDWGAVQPGDLVFMMHTYEPDEPPAADGFVASHVAVSLGTGTLQVIDANSSRGTIGVTNIGNDYWQPKMLSAGRHPTLAPPQAFVRSVTFAPAELVRGIDTASYQPTDLTALIAETGARHVVVKIYQQVERIGGRLTGAEHSAAQIRSAQANGASVGGYIWCYASRDPAESVRDGLNLARSCGVALPLLWLDIEPYTDGSLPGADWIRAALAECEAQGVRGGIYSGAWVWPRLGSPQFPGVPLWSAIYDGVPQLDVTPYGGMRLVGKQFTTHPCDTNVFDPSVVA